jgi:hypothetical protein
MYGTRLQTSDNFCSTASPDNQLYISEGLCDHLRPSYVLKPISRTISRTFPETLYIGIVSNMGSIWGLFAFHFERLLNAKKY